MKLQNIFTIALIGTSAFACTNSTTSESITTENGIEITILNKGTEEIDPGMILVMDYILKTNY